MWAFFPHHLAIRFILKLVSLWTEISVSLFSADISKSREISRWRPIDKTLHYDFFATVRFFFVLLKTAHPQRLAFRKQCVRNIKIEYSQRFACNTHTHTNRQTGKLSTITLRLHAWVNNIALKI